MRSSCRGRLSAPVVGCAILFGLFGCATVPEIQQAPPPLPAVAEHDIREYRLSVEYYNQNEFGRTQEIVAYRAGVGIGREGDRDIIRWHSYDRALATNDRGAEWGDFVPDAVDALRFEPYVPGTGLAYAWGVSDFDLASFALIPGIRDAPKDLTGFQLYMHAIDLFTGYKVYPAMINNPAMLGPENKPLATVGDRVFSDQRLNELHLMDWKNLGKDLVMQTGFVEISYLADVMLKGKPLRLYSFQQSQRFGQTLTYQGFIMPMDETTRFMGHVWLDADGALEKIEFQEYVYVLVHAPMFIDKVAHTKRHFVLELMAEGESVGG
ncbi:MAG: hypothetical protein ACOYM2_03280 [Rectinemataceae bacterium]